MHHVATIAIASDHAGFDLKRFLTAGLRDEAYEVEDYGCDDGASADYPDYAAKVAENLASGRQEMGILICGSGIGMSIAANRHAAIRAALCADEAAAEMARLHNDANILVLAARRLEGGDNYARAYAIVRKFLSTEFSGDERHRRRIGKISDAV